jgi:amino acid adenylation domain-containing protein
MIPRRTLARRAPLSPAQTRLWIMHQLNPDDPSSNRPLALRIRGRLDQALLERALNEITRRHDILRTVFQEFDGEPVQIVEAFEPFRLAIKDLQGLPADEREGEAHRLAIQHAGGLFNLAAGPLFRCLLLRLDGTDHILLILMHHIIFDGWSENVLLRELTSSYAAFSQGSQSSPLPDLPIQYSDFALWQRERLAGGILLKQLSYWTMQLRGLEPVSLLTDRSRTSNLSTEGAKRSIIVPPELVEDLKSLGRKHRATLFMVLLTAFQMLLSRYTRQQDIAVGVPIAGRTELETEPLIGCFMNMLVFRLILSGLESFDDVLEKTRKIAVAAYDNQDLPFERLVQELAPQRSANRWPLFQVMFNLRNIPKPEKDRAGDLTIEPFPFEPGWIGGLDLSLEAVDQTDGLHCHLTYPAALFDAATMERLMTHYRNLLKGIAANPGQRISDVPLLMQFERQRLLIDWNRTRRNYPESGFIHGLFESQAARSPHAVALISEGRQVTYSELNERANQLAHYLIELGVGPDSLLGIWMNRSVELAVALLAVLKAGGAYVALDPRYPADRMQFILNDTGVRIILTQCALVERWPELNIDTAMAEPTLLALDQECRFTTEEPKENPINRAGPDNLAYIIYTSGSLGVPKAVMATHRGIFNYLMWRSEYFALTPADRLLQTSSICFDDSVWEFFEPLAAGATLVLPAELDVARLASLIAEHEITATCMVPSLLYALLDDPDLDRCTSLRRVTTGGEVLTADLKSRFYSRLAADLYNGYGPTEATIASCFWACDRHTSSDRTPIGKPVANVQIYILDSFLHPVPVGIAGEIYIGGAGLARGYLKRPDQTAERFIPHPFSDIPGERLYRTGDLARYLPDGNLEFLGRLDTQVKIRGHRIELEEIETVLRRHPGIRNCAAGVRQFAPGDTRLALYYVVSGSGPTPTELKVFLQAKLPSYMIPSVYLRLDAIPTTRSGKVDRKALASVAVSETSVSPAGIAPRNELEEQLVHLWSDVLGVAPADVRDNFFDLGGHSLAATRLLAKLRSRLGVTLPLRTVFEHPTVEELARAITTYSARETDILTEI